MNFIHKRFLPLAVVGLSSVAGGLTLAPKALTQTPPSAKDSSAACRATKFQLGGSAISPDQWVASETVGLPNVYPKGSVLRGILPPSAKQGYAAFSAFVDDEGTRPFRPTINEPTPIREHNPRKGELSLTLWANPTLDNPGKEEKISALFTPRNPLGTGIITKHDNEGRTIKQFLPKTEVENLKKCFQRVYGQYGGTFAP